MIITIPDSVTSIGEDAFYFCHSIVEVYNKSSLTITAGSSNNGHVGYYALNVYTPTSGESKLHTTDDGYIFYVDGDTRYLVKYIGSETDITLPESCQGYNYEIYKYAFYGYNSLTSITIPDGVTSIGNYAFYSCDSLTSVTIPDSVTSIGEEAFDDCSNLSYNKKDGIKYLGNDTNLYVVAVDADTSITSAHLPNGVKFIHSDAFQYCTSLTSITIPDSVTSIGEDAFYGCSSLTSITIPNSVTSIGDYAFYNCSSLTSITIPDSVTSIGNAAFSGCTSLIQIEDGVSYVGKWVVGCDTSVTTVELQRDTVGIANYAFSYCTSLTSITFNGTKAEWNAISKVANWDYITPNYIVYCTDGTIAKDGTET